MELPEIEEQDWPFYYTLPMKLTLDTKLQYFQQKILHRIITTNPKLVIFKIKESSMCSFCHKEKETILHLFWECTIVRPLWVHLGKWLKDNCDFATNFSRILVLFGSKNEGNTVNFISLLMKYYVYVCKCKEITPHLNGYIELLKKHITVDKFVAKTNQIWENKWSPLTALVNRD